MDCTSLFSSPYLIRTECGQEYDLFAARWLSVKDDTYVHHSLYLNPDHTYLYSTCNIFRDPATPETYQVITAGEARLIFEPYLSPQELAVYFPSAPSPVLSAD